MNTVRNHSAVLSTFTNTDIFDILVGSSIWVLFNDVRAKFVSCSKAVHFPYSKIDLILQV